MTSSSNLLLVLEEKDNMGDMRTPAKGKSCGLLPRLPDCKYSVPCASLCNDHYVIIVIIMCVFHDLKKKDGQWDGNGWRSARNWTFLYARSLTKSCRPCHAIRCLKMLKALLPPGLSCPPISSEANIFGLPHRGPIQLWQLH